MLTPAAKDRIARRLRGWGWLVWVLGAAGVVVGGWGVVKAWPESLLRGRPAAITDLAQLEVRIVPTGQKLPDGSQRWRIATESEPGPDETFVVAVSVQDIGEHVPYGRIYRVEHGHRWEIETVSPPDFFQVEMLSAEALRAWSAAHPENLPAGLVGQNELVVDLGMMRRLLNSMAAGARSGLGATGFGLIGAGLALTVARRCTGGWVLPSGRCPACGYDLAGLRGGGCPECGRGVG